MRSMRCVGVSVVSGIKKTRRRNSGGHGCTRGALRLRLWEAGGETTTAQRHVVQPIEMLSEFNAESDGNERRIRGVGESCFVPRLEVEIHPSHLEPESGSAIQTADGLCPCQDGHGLIVALTE